MIKVTLRKFHYDYTLSGEIIGHTELASLPNSAYDLILFNGVYYLAQMKVFEEKQ